MSYSICDLFLVSWFVRVTRISEAQVQSWSHTNYIPHVRGPNTDEVTMCQ